MYIINARGITPALDNELHTGALFSTCDVIKVATVTLLYDKRCKRLLSD